MYRIRLDDRFSSVELLSDPNDPDSDEPIVCNSAIEFQGYLYNQLIWIYFDTIFAFVLKGYTKPFRDILILMLEVSQVLGDGHCIINCFSQHLNIVKSQILQEVWEEFDHRKGKYLSFSSYELEEELMKALEEYLFGKKYGH